MLLRTHIMILHVYIMIFMNNVTLSCVCVCVFFSTAPPIRDGVDTNASEANKFLAPPSALPARSFEFRASFAVRWFIHRTISRETKIQRTRENRDFVTRRNGDDTDVRYFRTYGVTTTIRFYPGHECPEEKKKKIEKTLREIFPKTRNELNVANSGDTLCARVKY